MNIEMDSELRELQNLAKKFVERELLPLERELLENDGLSESTWKRLEKLSIELGLYNLALPIEYGGSGIGVLGQVLCAEELGKVSVAFRHLTGDPMGAHVIFKYGSNAAKAKYGNALINGEKRCGWGITEPQAGSDLSAIRSSAKFVEDRWILDGAKHFMTGVDRYDFLVTVALTEREKDAHRNFSAFIVEKLQEGFIVGREEKMMGREGLHSYELFFEGVEISRDNLLGEVGQGFDILMDQVHRMRLLMGGTCVGTAQRLLDMASNYASMRKQFNRRIGDFEAIQWMLADMKLRLEAARLLTYDAACKLDQETGGALETAMVKLYATEMVFFVADRAMQIHGGAGYCKDLPIESIFRACRLLTIAEGTSEIQRMLIGKRYLAKGIVPRILRG